MTIINLRDLVAFPGGENSSDTLIGGVHLNLTTLNYWNYTLYSNGTLSNGSWCMLTNPPYTPRLLYDNGTFINGTWCYTPVNSIGGRGKTGVGFAVGFGLALLFQLSNLRKHGRLYLPATKRFYPIGRRWQWYWGILVCATALVALFTNVDVDRYYVLELPIVLTTFFWFLMQWCAIALVWEAVRHWGSWMERQYVDPNPFELRQDDRRATIEFWLPLWFYLWLWLNFFLIVPRNWGLLELQRSPEQTVAEAEPMATDSRFKAAAFCLAVCWATTVFSLVHSVLHYRGALRMSSPTLQHLRPPVRFLFLVPLAAVVVAYQALSAFVFAVSPLNAHASNVPVYAGGYAPSLAILIVQAIYGMACPNEDQELMRQRRIRGDRLDRELGLAPKPAWWRRLHHAAEDGGWSGGAHGLKAGFKGMGETIARNVRELGGGGPTARGISEGVVRARANDLEMEELRRAESTDWQHLSRAPADYTPASVRSLGSTAASAAPSTANSSSPNYSHHTARYAGKSDRRRSERIVQSAAEVLFPAANSPPGTMSRAERHRFLMGEGPAPAPVVVPGSGAASLRGSIVRGGSITSIPPPPYSEDGVAAAANDTTAAAAAAGQRGRSRAVSGAGLNVPTPPTLARNDSAATGTVVAAGTATPAGTERSQSTGTLVSLGGQPQQVRSMLDI